ncbi:MAG: hypothetical protein JJU09_09670 [Rhodobacteraceae bacterium]|nr:hypothetical protein [Paracoccaceae bacterium]TVR44229.1 MAG: hypothetical protein EA386_14645 [Paracoccaceae bacterium]
MSGVAATIWQDLQRGIEAPLRLLVLGMLAAFVLSLPMTLALNLIGSVPVTVVYMLTGAVHALATFCVAGWMQRRSG